MSKGVSYSPLCPHQSITNLAHNLLEVRHEEALMGQVELRSINLHGEGGRKMTKLETVSASWVICDSWAGVAGTVALAVSQGGPFTLIYGPILTLALVGACALTLAELASVYPTAGGQYHWTSILAPKSMNRALVSIAELNIYSQSSHHPSELLLWYDQHVFLDSYLHGHCYHPRTTYHRSCLIL